MGVPGELVWASVGVSAAHKVRVVWAAMALCWAAPDEPQAGLAGVAWVEVVVESALRSVQVAQAELVGDPVLPDELQDAWVGSAAGRVVSGAELVAPVVAAPVGNPVGRAWAERSDVALRDPPEWDEERRRSPGVRDWS